MRNFSQKAFSGFAGKIGVMSFVLLFLSFAFASQASAAIVINEIYTAGGTTSATYNQDYVELYNNGTTSVDISGYSIQYSTATSTTYSVCTITSTATPTDLIIEAGTYFLIQFGTTNSGTIGAAIPSPDAICTTNLSGTSAKIALVSNTTALSGTCPATGATVVDFVGYGPATGTSAPNCFEGTGPAPAPANNQSSIKRAATGVDSNNNNTDFISGAPTPRNSAPVSSTAAGVSLGGRVANESGRGIWRATVMLTGGSLEAPVYAVTDYEGNYSFYDVPAGETYALSVSVKGYKFNQTSLVVNLNEDFNEAHFVGTPKERFGIK